MGPSRTWATPLECLLIAERAALLSGQDDDFVMQITIAYTGLRWGETIGLEREFCLPSLVNVEWQLRELNGRFHRLPPKDDSYRSLAWDPRIPVDLPSFLGTLLANQAAAVPAKPCACAATRQRRPDQSQDQDRSMPRQRRPGRRGSAARRVAARQNRAH